MKNSQKDLAKIERENHIYRTTNIETGEFYIGCSTWNWARAERPSHQQPEYLGSFTYQSWAELEYEEQRRVLRKDILGYGLSKEDTYDLEARLIDKAFDNPLNVNIHNPIKGFYSDTSGTVAAAPIDDPENFSRISVEEFKTNRDQYIHITTGLKRSDLTKRNQARKGKTLEEIHGEEKAAEMKRKFSKANRGENHNMWGKKRPDRAKLNKINKSKAVIHVESGKVFSSQTEAAKAFNTSCGLVSTHCRKKVKKQRFKFKEDSNE